jgi:hypothetical protein
MTFLKNIQFTHLIKIDGHLKEFNFRKPNGTPDTMFTIDTTDENNNRIRFNMKLAVGSWKLFQQELPSWIIENESRLHEVIQHELSCCDIYFCPPTPAHYRQFSKLFGIFG